jgi:cell fate regulator YaaT (PSP1 superfamily)
MAKNQNLVLNPTKVSGQCGRLKCCLVYEEAMYVEARRNLPRIGHRVETPEGAGRVEDLNVLGGRVRVCFPDRPSLVFDAAALRPLPGEPLAERNDEEPSGIT